MRRDNNKGYQDTKIIRCVLTKAADEWTTANTGFDCGKQRLPLVNA